MVTIPKKFPNRKKTKSSFKWIYSSCWAIVLSSVPQGSVLGPCTVILIYRYVNDSNVFTC